MNVLSLKNMSYKTSYFATVVACISVGAIQYQHVAYAMQQMDIDLQATPVMRPQISREMSSYADEWAKKLEAVTAGAGTYMPLVLWKIISEYRGYEWKLKKTVEINHDDSPFKTIQTLTHMMHQNKPIAISGSFHHDNIHLWDLETGEIYANLKKHAGSVRTILYVAEKNMLISGADDNSIMLWKLDSAELKKTYCIKTIDRHIDNVTRLALSPDHTAFASTSFDGAVCIWSIPEGTLSCSLQHASNNMGVLAWNYDGSLLLSGAKNTVRVWNVQKKSLLKQFTFKKRASVLVCSPAENYMAIGIDGESISLRNIVTGKIIRELEGSMRNQHGEVLEFSPSGMFIAVQGYFYSKVGGIWAQSTGALLTRIESNCVNSWVHFTADDMLLASGYGTKFVGDKNGRVNVYSCTT